MYRLLLLLLLYSFSYAVVHSNKYNKRDSSKNIINYNKFKRHHTAHLMSHKTHHYLMHHISHYHTKPGLHSMSDQLTVHYKNMHQTPVSIHHLHKSTVNSTQNTLLNSSSLLLKSTVNPLSTHNTLSISSEQQKLSLVKQRILHKLPYLPHNLSVTHSVIVGLYTVVVGGKVFYVTPHVKYVVFGNIIDTNSHTNMTKLQEERFSKLDWSKLPLQDAIKQVIGDGSKHKIAVFTSLDCPKCNYFYKNVLNKLNNVSLYLFLLPSQSGSRDQIVKVLCAKHPLAVYQNFVLHNTSLPKLNTAKCDLKSIDDVYKFSINVLNSVKLPVLINQDGVITNETLSDKTQMLNN